MREEEWGLKERREGDEEEDRETLDMRRRPAAECAAQGQADWQHLLPDDNVRLTARTTKGWLRSMANGEERKGS